MAKRKDVRPWRIIKNWIEFYPKFGAPSLTYSLCSYSDERRTRHVLHFCFIWGSWWIKFPWGNIEWTAEPPRYGIYFHARAWWICLGEKTKSISLPWDYTWLSTSHLLKDGTWATEYPGSKRKFWTEEEQAQFYSEIHPYTYTLKTGEVQERTATVTISKRTWSWILFSWLGFPLRTRRTIDITFSDEVGERTGSWKGGCIGCSWELLENELPVHALRRMEKERKF